VYSIQNATFFPIVHKAWNIEVNQKRPMKANRALVYFTTIFRRTSGRQVVQTLKLQPVHKQLHPNNLRGFHHIRAHSHIPSLREVVKLSLVLNLDGPQGETNLMIWTLLSAFSKATRGKKSVTEDWHRISGVSW
jgi:hypothetical protein